MDSFFVRYRNSLVLLVVVLAQTIALAVQVQRPAAGPARGAADGREVTLLRSWAMATVTPVERALNATSDGVRNVWSNYVGLRGARQQNRVLEQEVNRLRLEQTEFAEDAAEGRRLEKLLGFQRQYVASTVAAEVIGTSGVDGSHVLTLNKGSNDGLKPEEAVMTADGVVGKLRDVFPRTSQLLLLNDRTSGAGVVLATTRIRGILSGTANGRLEIDDLTADARIKPGEAVVTSGGDGVFPRGLPVGVVESIAPDPRHQPFVAIVVKPAAKLSELDDVLVLTGTTAELPPAAQQDAAEADAAAKENERAADLIAQRLPGLVNGVAGASGATGASGAAGVSGVSGASGASGASGKTGVSAGDNLIGGVPGVPNSGLPRVQPAAHPDKYSPGATPPAEDLEPGAAAGKPQ